MALDKIILQIGNPKWSEQLGSVFSNFLMKKMAN
jgi:hypothetical protein